MNYLRLCWYYLFVYDQERDGGMFNLTGWQRLRSTDGPIHTMRVWWLKITCSWFIIGWHCWRKGHAYGEQTITVAPGRRMVVVQPGVSRFEPTGKREIHKVLVCTWCGKYRGAWHEELP